MFSQSCCLFEIIPLWIKRPINSLIKPSECQENCKIRQECAVAYLGGHCVIGIGIRFFVLRHYVVAWQTNGLLSLATLSEILNMPLNMWLIFLVISLAIMPL